MGMINPVDLLPLMWKHEGLVIEKRGNGRVYKKAKYRTRKSKGRKIGEIRTGFQVHQIPPVEYTDMDITSNGKSFVMLYTPNGTDYFPVRKDAIETDLTGETVKLTVVDQNLEEWRSLRIKEAMSKWKKESMLMKVAPMLAVVIILVLAYLLMGDMLVSIDSMHNRGVELLHRATDVLEKSNQVLSSSRTITTPVNTPVLPPSY